MLFDFFKGKEEVYAEFVDRFTNYPEDTSISSVVEGLNFLKEDQSVIFVEQSNIRGYFKENQFHNQK